MVLVYELFERLLGLLTTLYELIFYEIPLPLTDSNGEPVVISLWIVLTGSSVIILFIAWLIKKLVPIA